MIEIKHANLDDIPAVNQLIHDVHEEFNARDYDPQGVELFELLISAPAIEDRYRNQGQVALTAVDQGKIVGYIEMRNESHIMLFFINPAYHGQGLGRNLFEQARTECIARYDGIEAFTVNASRYGVPFYEKLGFESTSPEEKTAGIVYTPMCRPFPGS